MVAPLVYGVIIGGRLLYMGYRGYRAAQAARKVERVVSVTRNGRNAVQSLRRARQQTRRNRARKKKEKCDKECQKKKKYKRPSGYRKGLRDKVWENAKDADGKVRDPLTGQVMKRDEPWDMGHKPGYEFRKHQQSAMRRGISRQRFLDEHNTASHFRPELPSSNQGHAGEAPDGVYYGF